MKILRKSDIRRALSEIDADSLALARDLDELLGAFDRFGSGGFAACGGYECGARIQAPHSIVERHALNPDEATADRDEFDRLVMRAYQCMAEAAGLARKWRPAASPEAQRRDLTGCEMMSLVGVWEPGRLTNVGGILDRKRRLCRWAIDYVSRNGRLPLRPEIEAHAQGTPVRSSA